MRQWLTLAILLIVPLLVTGCGLKKSGGNTNQTGTKTAASASPSANGQANNQGADNQGADSLGAGSNLAPALLGLDPTSFDSKIDQNRQQAEQKVKAWREDAVLYHMSAKLVSLQTGDANEVYTYGSKADAYNWWTMTVAARSGKIVRAIIPKEDYLGTSPQPIPVQFWRMNYIEAFQLADTNGGADFRSSHPDAGVSISLGVGQPNNYLWWTVEYTSATSEPYRILINPVTKEVLSESGETL